MSATRRPRRGVVTAFDEAAGLGTVVGSDAARYGFHCTALIDGSRQVMVGTEVLFNVTPGHRGLLEAAEIVKIALPDHA